MSNCLKAIFAGGCFWCTESTFAKVSGVIEVLPGYIGDEAYNANYNAVSTGRTKHYEAIEVTYDPDKVSYEKLLGIFWREIDPTDPDGQFADKGPQYKSAIFYVTEEERLLAEVSKKALEESKRFSKPIVTEILLAKEFYVAETYHCRYYEKNSQHYKMYRKGSGREDFLKRVWGEEVFLS
jgi:peptide methionine sulfoxide reductase msrA/msrB